jgi:hypothetical protein
MSLIRKVFITVKTYPTLSKKYDELVCTAGILDDGRWVRIYPLPFRTLDYENRYKKYQWMALPLVKNTAVNYDLSTLIVKANSNELSIAIFKPTELLSFVVEKTEREWNPDSLKILEAKANQLSIFQSEHEVRKEFSIVKKLPYKFSYRFQDSKGKKSTLMIEDWEIGALFWTCLQRSNGNEDEAIALVRKKYWDEFSRRDIFLFLGTTRQFHGWATNPFVIIGVFYPPVSLQDSLF